MDRQRRAHMAKSLRTKFGNSGMGSDFYEHVITYFVTPMVGDGCSAEKQFLKVDHEALTKILKMCTVGRNIVKHFLRDGQKIDETTKLPAKLRRKSLISLAIRGDLPKSVRYNLAKSLAYSRRHPTIYEYIHPVTPGTTNDRGYSIDRE